MTRTSSPALFPTPRNDPDASPRVPVTLLPRLSVRTRRKSTASPITSTFRITASCNSSDAMNASLPGRMKQVSRRQRAMMSYVPAHRIRARLEAAVPMCPRFLRRRLTRRCRRMSGPCEWATKQQRRPAVGRNRSGGGAGGDREPPPPAPHVRPGIHPLQARNVTSRLAIVVGRAILPAAAFQAALRPRRESLPAASAVTIRWKYKRYWVVARRVVLTMG